MSPATEAPGVDREVAEALRAEIAELVSVTEEIRGLQFLEEPSITVLSEQELAARIRADLESELEPDELETTQAWFQLLGLLPNDAPPLLDVYVNLLGEQVIGLYDLDTKELLVRGETAELSPLSRSTVVHELLTHWPTSTSMTAPRSRPSSTGSATTRHRPSFPFSKERRPTSNCSTSRSA